MTVRPVFEVPWERKGVLKPGLPILPHGVERHPVPGGGSRAVPIYAGDEVIVLDREGLQPGELVIFGPDRRSDAAMLGAKGQGRPTATIETLANGSRSGAQVLKALAAVGFNIEAGDAVPVFAEGSRPGDQVAFTAESDGLLICAAPGGPMDAHAQNAPTELILYIRRADPKLAKDNLTAPDPLADPLLDQNIQPGHAHAYEVKKGEYIQILDVKGRECSDFQAFSLRALDKGLEREIDPTTTRSLMGSLYPAPGIFSKYWSVDHEPLVEIVQDTCGRHDTFGLACTARYYEDLGYPGHVNCSDNMNIELGHHGIRPRGGWPAINFFFNTMLDDTNALGMDEPWSRPGDFVLLRALSDLVCVSSACPCDVDPANGWEPTDIQLRTYKAGEDFQRSIGYRKSAEADVEDTKKTGFHDSFAAHTRDFVEYNGYWLPNSFPNVGTIGEYWAVREKAAVMDLSPLRKFEVTGPDAEELLQLCLTRNIKKLAVGQVSYTAMCYEHGGMIDDGTVYRLGEMNFRWIGGNDTGGLWLRQQAQERGLNAWVRSSTDQMHNIAVQGRLSREILSQIFWTPPKQPTIDELGWFRLTIARVGDFSGTSVVISRTGYSGELGYEIFCHPRDAKEIFDRVWEVGAPMGMQPLGLAALDMMRIEAGLIFAGSEFDDTTDPWEAGIGFTVPLKSKNDDFIGRAALEERKAHPHRKLVGLEIEGGLVPSPGDCIRLGKAQVGEVTSAMKSPLLGRVIALGRVSVAHSEVGTALEVGQLDGQQKRLKAMVTSFPHFDPTKARVKGEYADG
ncbi:Aminomethyltransferase (glycine cleavage system T protein) [Candidatus Rhodobacter oscarellae]|uniref:Aminomethyltransferase (Glycine cleavage system T protein) n=1 Tax=Candidatus Rhodobacter oscarellae TaxID=1675527 RepID=A0A0J9E7N6_9RHOB|nr:aminomethyltransferase family protein [Candidatus Rhodobacter lobularis]KMW57784.1 Aminomethyltransferase (glycine cleavage system T protein) [Candidatus Rhodobacter lobularis]